MRIHIVTLRLGDVEDPEIYAAEPIMEFERTERGQWLKTHSYRQMEFTIQEHPEVYGFGVNIWAWLNESNLTFYNLKWGV